MVDEIKVPVAPEAEATADESLIENPREKVEQAVILENETPAEQVPDEVVDEKKELQFWSEFISVVNNPEISFFFVTTNKANAKMASWQLQTILRRSYLKILADFARHLKVSGYCGKIIVESDPDQDTYLIYAHNRMQAEGTGDGGINGAEYKKMVTSLSLVNKSNQDIDVQLADAMALIAGLKYEITVQNKKQSLPKIEAMTMFLEATKVEEATAKSASPAPIGSIKSLAKESI